MTVPGSLTCAVSIIINSTRFLLYNYVKINLALLIELRARLDDGALGARRLGMDAGACSDRGHGAVAGPNKTGGKASRVIDSGKQLASATVKKAAAVGASVGANVATAGASALATATATALDVGTVVTGHDLHTHVNKTVDSIIEAQAGKIAERIGQQVNTTMKNPYMPELLQEKVDVLHQWVWPRVQRRLVQLIMKDIGRSTQELKRDQLNNWASPPPFISGPPGRCGRRWLASVGVYLRAKYLYSVLPADASIWKILRDPVGIVVYMLKLNSATSVMSFLTLFALIEKTDEYQLVNFILRFKSFQFFSAGLIPAAGLGLSMTACLRSVLIDEPEGCLDSQPSAAPLFPLIVALEILRVVLVWTAFGLLASGYAYGGEEEIHALEYVRLDAADGEIDGIRKHKGEEKGEDNTARARAARKLQQKADDVKDELRDVFGLRPGSKIRRMSGGAEEVDDVECGTATTAAGSRGEGSPPGGAGQGARDGADRGGSDRMPGDEDESDEDEGFDARRRSKWHAALDEQRVQHAASTNNRGGALPYFLLFSEGSLVLLVAFYAHLIWSEGLDSTSPLFWAYLYNLKLTYGVLGFPYLIFALPLLGQSLIASEPTGYDESGLLVPKLTATQKRAKYEVDRLLEAAEREEQEQEEAEKANQVVLLLPTQVAATATVAKKVIISTPHTAASRAATTIQSSMRGMMARGRRLAGAPARRRDPRGRSASPNTHEATCQPTQQQPEAREELPLPAPATISPPSEAHALTQPSMPTAAGSKASGAGAAAHLETTSTSAMSAATVNSATDSVRNQSSEALHYQA